MPALPSDSPVHSPDFLYEMRRVGRRLYRTLVELQVQVPSARTTVLGVPVEFTISETETRIDVLGTDWGWRAPIGWITQDPSAEPGAGGTTAAP